MSTTLLTYGAQAATGTSTPVDCSALAIIRADIDLGVTSLPGGGELSITFEHGPSAAGPFVELTTVRLSTDQPPSSPYAWPSGKKHVLLSGFDAFIRLKWSARSTWSSPDLRLGVSG